MEEDHELYQELQNAATDLVLMGDLEDAEAQDMLDWLGQVPDGRQD